MQPERQVGGDEARDEAGKKERNGVLRRFQQLMSYRDEIESRNWEEIPFSSRIVPKGLSAAEGPYTALHNAAHL